MYCVFFAFDSRDLSFFHFLCSIPNKNFTCKQKQNGSNEGTKCMVEHPSNEAAQLKSGYRRFIRCWSCCHCCCCLLVITTTTTTTTGTKMKGHCYVKSEAKPSESNTAWYTQMAYEMRIHDSLFSWYVVCVIFVVVVATWFFRAVSPLYVIQFLLQMQRSVLLLFYFLPYAIS